MCPSLGEQQKQKTIELLIEKAARRRAARETPAAYASSRFPYKYWKIQQEIIESVFKNKYTTVKSCHSSGKGLRHGTPVLTTSGWLPIEQVKVGDTLIDGLGAPTSVSGVYPQGEQAIYRLTFNDGTSLDTDKQHLWQVKTRRARDSHLDVWKVKTTKEIFEFYQGIDKRNRHLNYALPPEPLVKFAKQEITLDPYVLGLLLGDGGMTTSNVIFSTADTELLEALPITKRRGSSYDYGVTGVVAPLRKLGLLGKKSEAKFIPKTYIYNTVTVRLALLQGLLDTDGGLSGASIEFSSSSERLALDVQFLVRSLGGYASIRRRKTARLDNWRVYIRLDAMCPFRLERKVAGYMRLPIKKRATNRLIESVELIGRDKTTCIAVDSPSKLFITKDFIVTHNTFLAASVVLLYMEGFVPSKCITTATTNKQVEMLLWSEINTQFNKANPPYPWVWRILNTNLKIAPDHFALGFASDEDINFQGFHCLSDDTEYLTNEGWKTIYELTTNNLVLGVDKNKQASWVPIDKIHKYEYDGLLQEYQTNNLSFAVTDNHRFMYKTVKDTSWDIQPFTKLPKQFRIPRSVTWSGKALEVPEEFRGFSPKEFASFVGFWTGDGGTRKHCTNRFYEVLLYQTKPKGCSYIEKLLCNKKYTKARDYYAISSRPIAEWLIKNVGRYGSDRKVPDLIKNSTPEILEAYLDGLWEAEGSYYGGRKRELYNTSKKLMDGVQELLLKLGLTTKLGVNRKQGTATNLTDNTKTCYVLSYPLKHEDTLVLKKKITQKPYKGTVGCVTTPTGTFVARHKGTVFVSGNSENFLLVADEAAGIPQNIFDSLSTLMTPRKSKMLLISNPDSLTGYFYHSHEKAQFHKFTISAFDTPNFTEFDITMDDIRTGEWQEKVKGKDYPYDGLCTPDWAREKYEDWGEDSPLFIAKVFGEFPKGAIDTLFPLMYIEQAQKRNSSTHGTRQWGLDVARMGIDATVLRYRRGDRLEITEEFRKFDTVEVADWAGHIINRVDPSAPVAVDAVGIGAGVADMLRSKKKLNVFDYSGSGKSSDDDCYNQRSEFYWHLSNIFRKGQISGKIDEDTKEELACMKYKIPNGKVRVMKKDDIKKVIGHSPDKADALMLTYAPIDNMTAVNDIIVARTDESKTKEKNEQGVEYWYPAQ